jgi:hypothetical protein
VVGLQLPVVPIIVGTIFAFVASLIGMVLLRGGHKFYRQLLTYHRLPRQYDPILAHKGTPEDGTIEEVTAVDFSRDVVNVRKHISDIPKNQVPRILYNFDENTCKRATEQLRRKIVILWFYSAVGNLIGVGIIAAHLMVLSSVYSVGTSLGPGLLGTSIMLSGFHAAIRVSTLSGTGIFYEDNSLDEGFRTTIRDFGHSFFASLYFLWAFAVTILFLHGRYNGAIGSAPSPGWLITVLAAIIVGPLLSSVLSEYALKRGVNDDLTDERYETEMIFESDD